MRFEIICKCYFSHFKKLYGYALDYSLFRVFSCTCFIFHPYVKHRKLSFRYVICVFLGYGKGKKRYRCFDPITQKLYVSRHVVFLEHIYFFSIPSTTYNLTRPDLIRIDLFLRILIIHHLRFLVPQILLSMFN
jgi:hypothetical protein